MNSSLKKDGRLHGILAAASLLEGLLLGVPPFVLIIFVPLVWLALYGAITELRQVRIRQEKLLLVASAVLSGLLCVMLPLTWLTDRDQLYNTARGLGISGALLRGANLIDNLVTIGLTFVLVFVLISGLWAAVARLDRQGGRAQRTRSSGWPSILLYGFPCLLFWSVFLYAYWPGIMLPDSYTQWQMIHGLLPFSDWHPITHTLIEGLLMRIWDSPAVVAIFQVIALGLTWGWAMVFFETQGISRKMLVPLSILFALLPFNGIQMVTLLKDELYTVSILALVILIGKIWVTGGAWLGQRRNQAALGIFLALPYLLRHNGLLILFLVPLGLLLSYRSTWKAVAAAVLLGLTLVVGLRNGVAFGLLKTEPNPAAVMYVIPIQHISAVGHYGGEFTPEQEEILRQVAPMQAWHTAYNPYYADNLTKPWGATKDQQITEKIDRVRGGLLRTFAQVSVKYPQTVFRSELDLMSLLWMVNFPEKERPWVYEYSTASYKVPSNLDPTQFTHPNQGTPVNAAMTAYLSWSSGPVGYAIFWRGGLYLFASLVLMIILFFARGPRSLLLFLPSLANVLSLAVSMPQQSFRYIYAFVVCVPLLALFAFTRREGANR